MPVRVVYWSNIPSPYVVGRFNALARRGAFEFEAWFDRPRDPDRSWDVAEDSWEFPARYLAENSRRMRAPLRELEAARPDLLVSWYAEPHYITGTLRAKSLGIRTAFRVLPTFDAWVRRNAIKEAAKHYLFRTVDAVKVPGPDGAALARRYGVPEQRIMAVTQSVDVAHYSNPQIGSQAEDAARALRMSLPSEGPSFIYVGRLWKGKGLDYLFDAFETVVSAIPSASLVVVGDGVDEATYRARAVAIPNVAFAGFVQPAELPSYYHHADALVFATLGDPHGLVVEEAMAAGLPVITTSAAGDIYRRLPIGEAGLIVPPADSAALASAMLAVARNPELRRQMSARAVELVATRSHDHWAADFERFVNLTLTLPRKNGPVSKSAGLLGRLTR